MQNEVQQSTLTETKHPEPATLMEAKQIKQLTLAKTQQPEQPILAETYQLEQSVLREAQHPKQLALQEMRYSEPVASQGTRNAQPEAEQPSAIRTYKDTLFRMIFKDKEELLSLYNAVNDTHYADPSELEITTLENAVYMNVKNDVSCILDMRLNLYEHQSSVNPNMPLRDLFYVAKQFQKLLVGKDI
ncbi:MAG: hypothetical protein IJ711_00555, partial [Lachnospiraceae bacterium]|nr:hypothetical protein [Lachnospiraceae bacterium]